MENSGNYHVGGTIINGYGRRVARLARRGFSYAQGTEPVIYRGRCSRPLKQLWNDCPAATGECHRELDDELSTEIVLGVNRASSREQATDAGDAQFSACSFSDHFPLSGAHIFAEHSGKGATNDVKSML